MTAPGMTLRLEIFPADLDAVVDFYCGVLGFQLERDERNAPSPYVAMRRGAVYLGAVPSDSADPVNRRPPTGVEIVLEVDDVQAERDRVGSAGWPIEEDLTDRPWGLRDFRILDPVGHYLRLTNRSSVVTPGRPPVS